MIQIVNIINIMFENNWFNVFIHYSGFSFLFFHHKFQSIKHLFFLFPYRDDIWILLSCFIDRLYNVNHVQFISQDLVKRLRNHFQNISHNHNRKDDDGNGNEISASPLVESRLGHRKNQHSISSIMTNVSQSSSSSSDDDDDDDNVLVSLNVELLLLL